MITYLYAQSSFTDRDGLNYNITIEGVDPTPTDYSVLDLMLDSDGISISYDGDNDSHYGIINSTAKISFIGNVSLFNLLAKCSDMSFCIKITSDEFNWFGWIIADGLEKSGIGELSIISFTAKDPFTALKSVHLTSDEILIDNNGFAYFKIIEFIRLSLAKVTPSFKVPILNIYSNLCTIDTGGISDTLSIVKGITGIASILDDDNNYRSCYDIIETILKSYPYKVFFYDMELQFEDVNYISKCINNTINIIKTTYNGSLSSSIVQLSEEITTIDKNESKFLTGDIMDIDLSVSKAYKELSYKYSTSKLSSALRNSNFTLGLNYWMTNSGGLGNKSITIVGDGNLYTPHAMRVQSDVIRLINKTGQPDITLRRIERPNAAVAQVIPVLLGKGSTGTVEIRFKTTNVHRSQANDIPAFDFTPDIYFETVLVSNSTVTSMQNLADNTLYAYDISNDSLNTEWLGMDKDWYIPATNVNNTIYRYLNGNIVSCSFDVSETPTDGYFGIVFYPFFFDQLLDTTGDSGTYSQRPYYDIVSVDVTLNNAANINKLESIKEETYDVIQNGTFSESEDQDMELCEKYDKAWVFAYGRELNGSVDFSKSSHKRVNSIDNKAYDLGLLLTSDRMNLVRKPCVKSNFSIKGLLDFRNIVKIDTISGFLMPTSVNYDLVNRECDIETLDCSIQEKTLSSSGFDSESDYYDIKNDYTDQYKYEYRNKSLDYYQKEAKAIDDNYG